MKKFILLLIVIIFSCEKKQEKSITNVNVDLVSTGKSYGRHMRPPFNITKIVIENNEYIMQTYIDTIAFKRVDSLKLYNSGKIFFNNLEVEKIDAKNIIIEKKYVEVQKIYIPHVGKIGVDDFGGEIIYLANNQMIARYGTISNYISLYNPNVYSELHKIILLRKIDFKRHLRESQTLP